MWLSKLLVRVKDRRWIRKKINWGKQKIFAKFCWECKFISSSTKQKWLEKIRKYLPRK